MVLTVETFKRAVPNLTSENAGKYIIALNETLQRYNINTPLRVAHFLSQAGHESASFSVMSENLNYSVKGLMDVFRKYFDSEQKARQYARQPQKIANKVYANRLGNGNEASGDGWRYRGKGCIQITGKINHELYGKNIGVDFVSNPELLLSLPYVIDCAGWYFSVMNLLPVCDNDNVKVLTRKINGGYHGYDDRVKRLMIAKTALGV